MIAPLVILHRRNRPEQLTGLPPGCWIEIDVDLRDGVPCVSHAPAVQTAVPLETFLPAARKAGVAGFIFDCKRERAAKAVQPLLKPNGIADYFYLNEMEIEADILLGTDANHRTALRIWQYRGASDVIRYIEARKASAPRWIWADCWQRGLAQDIGKAFLPLNRAEAGRLQQLAVRLCLCSPELYAHDYGKTYSSAELQNIYRGIVNYRQQCAQAGLRPDAICTKFSWLWTKPIEALLAARDLSAQG